MSTQRQTFHLRCYPLKVRLLLTSKRGSSPWLPWRLEECPEPTGRRWTSSSGKYPSSSMQIFKCRGRTSKNIEFSYGSSWRKDKYLLCQHISRYFTPSCVQPRDSHASRTLPRSMTQQTPGAPCKSTSTCPRPRVLPAHRTLGVVLSPTLRSLNRPDRGSLVYPSFGISFLPWSPSRVTSSSSSLPGCASEGSLVVRTQTEVVTWTWRVHRYRRRQDVRSTKWFSNLRLPFLWVKLLLA